jgi:hypothetical protein
MRIVKQLAKLAAWACISLLALLAVWIGSGLLMMLVTPLLAPLALAISGLLGIDDPHEQYRLLGAMTGSGICTCLAVTLIGLVRLFRGSGRTRVSPDRPSPRDEETRAAEPQVGAAGRHSSASAGQARPLPSRWGVTILLAVGAAGLVVGVTLTVVSTNLLRRPALEPVQTVVPHPTYTPTRLHAQTPPSPITPTPKPNSSTVQPAKTPTATSAPPPSGPDPDEEYMTCLTQIADLSEALNQQLDAAWASGDDRETFCESWLSKHLLENARSIMQLHDSCTAPQHRDLVEARGHLALALEHRIISIELISDWCMNGGVEEMEQAFEESDRHMRLANELIDKAITVLEGS